MLSTEKTLSEVIEILRLRGYTEDFNLLEENISYKIGGEKVNLSDIVIDKIYRFTGLNDLEDDHFCVAVSSQQSPHFADGIMQLHGPDQWTALAVHANGYCAVFSSVDDEMLFKHFLVFFECRPLYITCVSYSVCHFSSLVMQLILRNAAYDKYKIIDYCRR